MRSDHISACSRIKCPLRESLSAGMSVSIGSEAAADNQFLRVCFGERVLLFSRKMWTVDEYSIGLSSAPPPWSIAAASW
jgi:hypothetical protein